MMSNMFSQMDKKLIAWSSVLPEKVSRVILVCLNILVILMSPMAVHGMDGLGRWKHYSKWGIVCMALIVLLLYRYKERDRDKNAATLRVGYLLCIGMFLAGMLRSELLIPKVRPVYQWMSGCYLAYILLGMVVGRSKQMKEQLYHLFFWSVEISFAMVVPACFLFRPVVDGVRYFGIYPNANTFSIYLTLVIVASVWLIHRELLQKKNGVVTAFVSVSFVLSFFFIVKTGSRTALLNAMLSCFVLAALILLKKLDRQEKKVQIRRLAIWGISMVLGLSLAYTSLDHLLHVIPDKVAHPIYSDMDPDSYQRRMKRVYGTEPTLDLEEAPKEKETLEEYRMVKMGSDSDSWISEFLGEKSALSRLLESFNGNGLSGILGPRGWIFQYGLEHMDWDGHENGTFQAEGHATQPHLHNGYIQNGYVYGYVCMFANLLINGLLLIYLLKSQNRNTDGGVAAILIYAIFSFIYMFEGGSTVIRDVLAVPYMMMIGMMSWNFEKKGFRGRRLAGQKK